MAPLPSRDLWVPTAWAARHFPPLMQQRASANRAVIVRAVPISLSRRLYLSERMKGASDDSARDSMKVKKSKAWMNRLARRGTLGSKEVSVVVLVVLGCVMCRLAVRDVVYC